MQVVQFLQTHYTFDDKSSIECVRQHVKRPRIAITPLKKNKVGRHVVWNPFERNAAGTPQYALLRAGIPIRNEAEAAALFSNGTIEEEYFYLFKNTDPKVQRNQVIPVYEAAYYCSDGNYYIRVQKRYLKKAYAKKQRCDKSRMWDLLEDGTPYWVDRHAFCKQGQRENKKRYQENSKKKP